MCSSDLNRYFFNRVTIGIYKESAQAKAGALPLMGHRTALIQQEMSPVAGSPEVGKGLSSHPMVSIVFFVISSRWTRDPAIA